uniref:Helitron helicase-like domain-containing protein n=1 Tax=Octopus bimaculoides TaxID=37653 RepID=A0A0L8GGT0_OCTBM
MYKLHLTELLKDIKDIHVFVVSVAHVHVIEFQKKGLPHCHMLAVLRNENKLKNRHDIDKMVSAEFPDSNNDPVMHDLVEKLLIHGICDEDNPSSLTMHRECVLSKTFPKK